MRWLDGKAYSMDEFKQTMGDNEEQGRLEFHSTWGHKELDTTE